MDVSSLSAKKHGTRPIKKIELQKRDKNKSGCQHQFTYNNPDICKNCGKNRLEIFK